MENAAIINNRRVSGVKKTRFTTDGDVKDWVDNKKIYRPEDGFDERQALVQYDGPADDVEAASTSTSSSDCQPLALDGGFGWVIVLISFFIHFICDGLSFSFGMIYPAMQETFDSARLGASVVASFYLAIPLLGGPIAGTLTDIYDCRATTILGGLLAGGGTIIAWAGPNNIWFFGFFFGIVTAVSGSGAGTLVFPWIIEKVLAHYDFWWAILLYGITFLFLVLLGIWMRDVEWPNETTEYKRNKFLRKLDKMKEDRESVWNADLAGFNTLLPVREAVQERPRLSRSMPVIPVYADEFLQKIEPSNSIQSIRQAVLNLQDNVTRSKSFGLFRNPVPKLDLPPLPEDEILTAKLDHLDLQTSTSPYNTITSKSRTRMYSNHSMSMDALDQMEIHMGAMTELGPSSGSSSDSALSNDGDSSSSELSDHILTKQSSQPRELSIVQPSNAPAKIVNVDSGIVMKWDRQGAGMPGQLNQTARGIRTSMVAHSRVPASNATGLRYMALRDSFRGLRSKVPSAPTLFVKKKKKKTLKDVLHLKQMKNTITDTAKEYWRLARDWRFSAYLFSIFLLYMFYDIPYVNFPEFVDEHLGVPLSQASSLVAGIGGFNLISMFFCGFLSDRGWIKEHLFLVYGVMISLCGVCLLLSTIAQDYRFMLAISWLYGFFIASNYVLGSVLLCELMFVSDFQNGYGFLSMTQGIGNLIGPALVGWVRDATNSYQVMFIVGAVGMIISGIICIGIHVSWEDEDEETENSRKPSKKLSNSNVHNAEEGKLEATPRNGILLSP
ncbi:unnamed protein product, partial [Mesorhabditis spiculigera]